MRHAGITPAGAEAANGTGRMGGADGAGGVDRPREECGVFGARMNPNIDAVLSTFYGLMSLQHRGQDSAGIASSDGNAFE